MRGMPRAGLRSRLHALDDRLTPHGWKDAQADMAPGERKDQRIITAVMMVTTAMGALDSITLLYLKVFTGYMTATLILSAIHLFSSHSLLIPGMSAIGSYAGGAMLGGYLVRREQSRRRTIADILLAVGALVVAAALIWSLRLPFSYYVTLVTLAFSMGLQTSATRYAQVADLTVPAATGPLHGLAHDNPLVGGSAKAVWRRIMVIGCLFGGAILGTLAARLSVTMAVIMVGVTIASTGVLLYLPEHPLLSWLERVVAGPHLR